MDGPVEALEENRATITPESVAREAAEIEKSCSREIWSTNFAEILQFNKETGTMEDLEQVCLNLKNKADELVASSINRANRVAEMGTLACEVLERRLFAANSVDTIVNSIAPKLRDHMTIYPLITPAGKILTFKLDENGSAVTTDLPPEYTGMEVYVNRRLKRGYNRGGNYQSKRGRHYY